MPPSNQEITLSLHPRLGVSTWSLHQTLSGGTPLLDIPAQVAAHGLSKLEVCHFHFPSTETEYLTRFRTAIADSGVEFYTLLIDEGDLTHPDPAERQKAIVSLCHWIDVARECGAARVRVSAGNEAPTPETLQRSVIGLEEVCRYAKNAGVGIVTENWHAQLDRPAEVLSLLESLHGELGLKMDFGNWGGARKYDDLAKIAPLAVCTHAKAAFADSGEMDEADFARCLAICQNAEFTGPHILIFSDPGDEWASLDLLRDFILPTLATN